MFYFAYYQYFKYLCLKRGYCVGCAFTFIFDQEMYSF